MELLSRVDHVLHAASSPNSRRRPSLTWLSQLPRLQQNANQTDRFRMPLMDASAAAAAAGQQWQSQDQAAADVAETASKLPSFYSPPSRPSAPLTESNTANNDDVSSGDETSLDRDTPVQSENSHPKIAAPRPSASLLRGALEPHYPSRQDPSPLPPPSLLSPAFTPPGTPGTATPTTSVPPGVPVDSTLPSGGGCGTKRPRLLETLPNVQCIVRARIPTVIPNRDGSVDGPAPQMFLHLYKNDVDDKEHLAIVFGNNIRSRSLDAPRPGETEMDRMIRGAYTGVLYPGRTTSGGADGQEATANSNEPPSSSQIPLVRIHSECYTGETAWSARCDCGEQLDEAARLMSLPASAGGGAGGIIIYLRQEGRGIGLGEKLKAYNLQDLGSDTVEANLLLRHPADARSYGLATAILRDLGQREIRLLTNNPDKIRAVEGPNREIAVKERVAMIPLSWRGRGGFRSKEVEGYLKTKIEKMGHMLDSSAMPP